MTTSRGKPNALRALEEAKRSSMARAEEQASQAETLEEWSVEDAIVQIVINMYASGLRLGMGILPDGMAVYVRLTFPATSNDPRAGMVSFVAAGDVQACFSKAILALEASAESTWWKKDRFAAQ